MSITSPIDANAICRDVDCPRAHCTVCTTSSNTRLAGRHPAAGFLACSTCVHQVSTILDDLLDGITRLGQQALEGSSPAGRLLAASTSNPGGEALLLCMPHADAETRERRLDLAAGDVDDLLDVEDERTPMEVHDGWALVIARARGITGRIALTPEHLTWAAQHLDAYAVMHADLLGCLRRIAQVLGDAPDRRVTPVPCRECEGTLVRSWGPSETLDGFECTRPTCSAWYSSADVAASATWLLHTEPAPGVWLSIAQAADVLGVPDYTVRTWGQRGRVQQRVAAGARQMWWPDLVAADSARRQRAAARGVPAATA